MKKEVKIYIVIVVIAIAFGAWWSLSKEKTPIVAEQDNNLETKNIFPKTIVGNRVIGPDGNIYSNIYIAEQSRVYRDRNGVSTDLIGADPNSIQVILVGKNKNEDPQYPFTYLKDNNSVYVETQKIEDADPATFKIFLEKYYSADKNNVYFSDYNKSGEFIVSKIVGADPKSFNILSGTGGSGCGLTPFYALDNNYVYYKNKLVTGADLPTFLLLTVGYAKDKNNVYKGENIVKDADPKTFQPPLCISEGGE